MFRLLILLLLPLLAACMPGRAGPQADAPAALPGGSITVTSLPPTAGTPGAADEDVPAEDRAPMATDEAGTGAAVAAVPAGGAAEAGAAEAGGAEGGGAEGPAPAGTVASADDQPAAPAPAVAGAPPPSPAALSCQRRGGSYVGTGQGAARACVRPTGDGGKRCTREGDCTGVCLARSRTCAPVAPLFGCNDILQADGRQVTLCLD